MTTRSETTIFEAWRRFWRLSETLVVYTENKEQENRFEKLGGAAKSPSCDIAIAGLDARPLISGG